VEALAEELIRAARRLGLVGPVAYFNMQAGPGEAITGLAIKLVAFGKLAFVQSIERSPHTSMNERRRRLDNDAGLIGVAVTEPIKVHSCITVRYGQS